MGTFSNSWNLMKMCFKVLKSDPEILLFPILSGLAIIIAIATFIFGFAAVIFSVGILAGFADWLGLLIWPAMFIYYIVTYFIVIFFNVAVIGCATIRLNGGDPTLGDGFKIAFKHIGKIFLWALISATVGIILQMLRSGKGVAGLIGRIVASIIGVAWSIVTYFVVPVMIYEDVGPIGSIKRSVQIIRGIWGESAVANIGLGFAMFVLSIPGILAMIMGFILLFVGSANGSAALAVIGIVLIVLSFLWFLGLAVVNSAAKGVLLAALYRFARTGDAGQNMDPYLIQNVLRPA
ncbi:MAG: DUF6159 family protein [Thermoplasmata archaeon]